MLSGIDLYQMIFDLCNAWPEPYDEQLLKGILQFLIDYAGVVLVVLSLNPEDCQRGPFNRAIFPRMGAVQNSLQVYEPDMSIPESTDPSKNAALLTNRHH